MAHQARLDRPVGKDPILGTFRDNLLVRAEQGDAEAIETLAGPPYPDELGYLHEWARELHHARPVGPNGPGMLTYPDLDAWARLMGRDPNPQEVGALLNLGGVMLYPPDPKDETDG